MPFFKYGDLGDDWGNPSTVDFRNISAGAINAAELILVGATSILRSSNFDDATMGWKITGEGVAKFRELFADSGELGDLTITGTLTMGTGGVIRTSSSGPRVELSAAAAAEIRFYPGDADHEDSVTFLSFVSGSGVTRTLSFGIRPPHFDGASNDGSIQMAFASESQDGSSSESTLTFNKRGDADARVTVVAGIDWDFTGGFSFPNHTSDPTGPGGVPRDGSAYVNTSSNEFKVFEGGSWRVVGSW